LICSFWLVRRCRSSARTARPSTCANRLLSYSSPAELYGEELGRPAVATSATTRRRSRTSRCQCQSPRDRRRGRARSQRAPYAARVRTPASASAAACARLTALSLEHALARTGGLALARVGGARRPSAKPRSCSGLNRRDTSPSVCGASCAGSSAACGCEPAESTTSSPSDRGWLTVGQRREEEVRVRSGFCNLRGRDPSREGRTSARGPVQLDAASSPAHARRRARWAESAVALAGVDRLRRVTPQNAAHELEPSACGRRAGPSRPRAPAAQQVSALASLARRSSPSRCCTPRRSPPGLSPFGARVSPGALIRDPTGRYSSSVLLLRIAPSTRLARWICESCGFIYDPERRSRRRHPAGTRVRGHSRHMVLPGVRARKRVLRPP